MTSRISTPRTPQPFTGERLPKLLVALFNRDGVLLKIEELTDPRDGFVACIESDGRLIAVPIDSVEDVEGGAA